MPVAQMSALSAPSRIGAISAAKPSARPVAVVSRMCNVRRVPIHAVFGGSCGDRGWSSDATRRIFNTYGRAMGGRPGSFGGGVCFPGGGLWTAGMTPEAEKALKEMYKQWQQYVQSEMQGAAGSPSPSSGSPSLPLDVTQDDLKYVVYADVPGLAKSDLSIKLSKDNVLTISGARKPPVSAEETTEGSTTTTTTTTSPFLLQQRPSGSFERKWTLPEDADTAAISAKVTDGVLMVTIGKKVPEPEVDDTQDIPWV